MHEKKKEKKSYKNNKEEKFVEEEKALKNMYKKKKKKSCIKLYQRNYKDEARTSSISTIQSGGVRRWKNMFYVLNSSFMLPVCE